DRLLAVALEERLHALVRAFGDRRGAERALQPGALQVWIERIASQRAAVAVLVRAGGRVGGDELLALVGVTILVGGRREGEDGRECAKWPHESHRAAPQVGTGASAIATRVGPTYRCGGMRRSLLAGPLPTR